MFPRWKVKKRQLFSNDDLQTFIPPPNNSGSFLESAYTDFFHEIYSTRSENDESYWLFDISSYASLKDWMKKFEILKIDLDANLYLYSFNNGSYDKIDIWECYR